MNVSEELKTFLFPVVEADISYKQTGGESKRIPSHKAIINEDTGATLGVVGRDYHVILNKDALSMGNHGLNLLLNRRDSGLEPSVFNVFGPASKKICHMDLVNEGVSFLLRGSLDKEKYMPFVRVTNSYNASRALKFDIGFCRVICKNGIIFGDQSLKFKFSHTKNTTREAIEFKLAEGHLQNLIGRFIEDTARLSEIPITFVDAMLVLLHVFRVQEKDYDREKNPQQYKDQSELIEHFRRVNKNYFSELGENCYALLNTMTELASDPPENSVFRREINSMQVSVGRWIGEVITASRQPGFSMQKYVHDHLGLSSTAFISKFVTQ